MLPAKRMTLSLMVCLVLALSPLARAQALKNLPADALVVVKLNKPDAVSKKIGAMAQRLGVAQMEPGFADPLAALKNILNIKEGFDGNGEVAIAAYDSGEEGAEPLVVVLIPVTDFKALVGGMANAKQEGELWSFTMPNDVETIYAANWGNYAAITPTKELLAKKPAGITVQGLAAKQLDANDITVWANAKLIASKVLPKFKEQRAGWLTEMEDGLKNELPNQKFVPVIKVVVNQLFNGIEQILMDGQNATFSINFTDKGINTSTVAEFQPGTYIGKLMAEGKNSNESLLKGLPDRKYFAFGGFVGDPARSAKLLDDMFAPVSKELAAVGDDAKPIIDMIDALKGSMTSFNSMSFGYAQPTAPLGQQGAIQAVMVGEGDSKKFVDAQKKYLQSSAEFMKSLGGLAGPQMEVQLNPAAKTVDGVQLDNFTMNFKMDPNDPAAAQAGMAIAMMYGPNGMSGHMGAIDDKRFVAVMGGDDDLLTAGVTSAKKGETALGDAAHVKAVAAELPQNRAVVYYIALDNILGTVQEFAVQNGFLKQPIKLPPDMPPIGITIGTEGPALRIDTHISTELIEKLVSAGMQAAMMMQQGRGGGL